MRSGYVAKIRIPPADVMTCIDLVTRAGYATQGMSLAECIRLALSGLCAGARKSGLAPERSGFEYDQMTSPFLKYSQTKKLEFTRMAQQDMVQREAYDRPPRGEQIANMAFSSADKERMDALSARRKQLLAQGQDLPPHELLELTDLVDHQFGLDK